jgi:ABC-2 type transport system permease protein
MKNLIPLMQREWLQHRFGWMLMVLIPLGIALAIIGLGEINIDAKTLAKVGDGLPTMLAVAAMVGGMAVTFVIAWISSLIIASGIARRDHSDRSVEFWMSLPSSHSESIAAPLIVHLLLVPMAAVVVGLASGWLVSLVLVTRVAGIGAWFALPWPQLLAGTFSIAARFVAGLPLATLWLLPLTLLIILLTAWFRRWGWVILGVGIGLGSQLLERLFGQPLLSQVMKDLLQQAGRAMVSSEQGLAIGPDTDRASALAALPAWVLHDFGMALSNLASPLLAGGLLFAAGCFALLVVWRQRGAGAAG